MFKQLSRRVPWGCGRSLGRSDVCDAIFLVFVQIPYATFLPRYKTAISCDSFQSHSHQANNLFDTTKPNSYYPSLAIYGLHQSKSQPQHHPLLTTASQSSPTLNPPKTSFRSTYASPTTSRNFSAASVSNARAIFISVAAIVP